MEILRTPTLWLPSPTPFPLLSRPNAIIFPHRGFGVEGLEWYQKQCQHIYGHVGIGDRGRSSKCHNFFDFWSWKLIFFTKSKPRQGESTQKVDFQNGPFPGDLVDVQKYDRVSKFTLDLYLHLGVGIGKEWRARRTHRPPPRAINPTILTLNNLSRIKLRLG